MTEQHVKDHINTAVNILNDLSAHYDSEQDDRRFEVHKAIHILWKLRDSYPERRQDMATESIKARMKK